MRSPSIEHRFKPGAEWTGHRNGRSKGRTVTARLRDLLDSHKIDGKPLPRSKCVADLVAEIIIKWALKGDRRFIDMVLDRTEGKPKASYPI